MKSVNNEQALLAVLLLLLTSLSTVSGSMPTIQSIETYFEETKPNKEDYQPMETKYGDAVEWDGANCRHGNKTNNTGKTRVSFDFRVLPKSKYTTSDKKSVTQGVPFEIGKYYEEL